MARSPAIPAGAPPPPTPARRTHRKAAPSVPDPDAMRLAIQSATGGKIYQWEQEARKEAQAASAASTTEEPLPSAGGARRHSRSDGAPPTPRQKPVKAATVAPKEPASDSNVAAAPSRETSTPAGAVGPKRHTVSKLQNVEEPTAPTSADKKQPIPAARRWHKEDITAKTVTGHLMRVSVWRQQSRPSETASSPPQLQIW
ncbi:hypothetical protein HDU87_002181 [Geranomyces variabilis]|uniref:Uncharacterized protein n=1 Tax=Geranomyces variabilis TaxID=109894 RepID=A0AAD5TML3_9FUNG|nr:hypothetical protein HDU87_002181 [Geranomyces variabilis]